MTVEKLEYVKHLKQIIRHSEDRREVMLSYAKLAAPGLLFPIITPREWERIAEMEM